MESVPGLHGECGGPLSAKDSTEGTEGIGNNGDTGGKDTSQGLIAPKTHSH